MTAKETLSDFFMETEKTNDELSEKFEKTSSYYENSEVYEYIKSHFDNLKIEMFGCYEGNIMDLMKKGLLEGWCWQTTETAILFLDDSSYIERGYLKFSKDENYWHSWIVFNYKGIDYVFDPCLQKLSKKEIYSKIFEVDVKVKMPAEVVREYFINYITNSPKHSNKEEIETSCMRIFGKELYDSKKEEIIIYGKKDVNAPMYRNGVGYRTTIEDGKIKKLIAHYYLNG